MTLPTLKLDSDVGDLTGYGLEPRFTVTRGGGPQQTGFIAAAGRLDNCLLDNQSRDLDPLWTPGPFFGTLRRKIGVTATVTWGSEYPVFAGRADDIPQSYPNHGVEQYVDFSATDLFEFLNSTPINTVRPAEKTSVRVQAVLDSIGYPGVENIDDGQSMVCAQDLRTVSALSHLGDVTQVEFGEMWIDAEGVFSWRGRPGIATDTRSTVVQAEYAQGPIGEAFCFVDVARGSLPIVNHVELTYGKDGNQVTVRDETSITAYDLQAMSISLPFETISQARSYGRWLLLLYAEPRDTILSVTFDMNLTAGLGDPFDLPTELLFRKEGDLVQVTLDPLAGDDVSGEPLVRRQWWRGATFDFESGLVQVALQDSWVDGLFYWDTSDFDGPDYYGL